MMNDGHKASVCPALYRLNAGANSTQVKDRGPRQTEAFSAFRCSGRGASAEAPRRVSVDRSCVTHSPRSRGREGPPKFTGPADHRRARLHDSDRVLSAADPDT